jgi:putative ABC transport system permease protein
MIRVGGTPMTIIGVLPKSFRLYMPSGVSMATDLDAWTTLRVPYASSPRDGAYLKVIGRLRPGVTVAQAQAEVSQIAERLRQRFAFHEAAGLRARVAPMHEAAVAHVESVLAGLAVAVGFVLLIGCANAANLLLVRLAARDREILVRTALGATRSRLVRQLLAESTVLALLGAAGGIGLGWAGVQLVHWLQPAALPHVASVAVDPTVLAFAVGLSLVSVLAFGLAPALLASRPDLSAGLRERAGTGGVMWRRLRGGLVVAEVALSVVLLVGAGVMMRTIQALQTMEVGFESRGVATFRVSLPFTRYRQPGDWSRFAQDFERHLRAAPGVRAVGAADALPASGASELEPFALEASREDREWGARSAAYRTVTPGFFAALSIPVRAGRLLAETDAADRPRAIVVDEALAQRLWPNESPVGQRLQVSVSLFDRGYRVERVAAEVVGVVGTVAHGRPDARPPGTIYLPHAQQPLWNMAFVVATDRSPDDAVVAARGAVRQLDSALPVYDVRAMDAVVAETMASTRMVLSSLAVFAAVAAILASVGLYAVVAYIVRQRRKELSIRIALGATPRSLGVGVLREGLTLVVVGIVVGVVLSMAAAGALSSLIVGVPPRDPRTLAMVSVLLLAAGALSSFVPAYRASSVDPIAGLREE